MFGKRNKKDVYSVMGRQSFGTLSITKNGVTVKVPEKWLTKQGAIKKQYVEAMNNLFNIATEHTA